MKTLTRTFRIGVTLIGALCLCSSLTLPAAIITWSGGTNSSGADIGTGTDFTVATNWYGSVAPGSSDIGYFTNTPTTGQPAVNSTYSVGSFDLATTSGGWTLSGAGTLQLATSGTIGVADGQTSGTNTVSVANITLPSTGTSQWNIFSSNGSSSAITLNISSSIALNGVSQFVLNLQCPSASTVGGTNNITGAITGTSSTGVKFTCAGGYSKGMVKITGANSSYSGPTIINQISLNYDQLATSGNNSSFGTNGTVMVVNNSSTANANYVGTGGSTDRQWLAGGTGQANIYNNGSGAISFNNTGSAIGGTANAARILSLGGANTGNNIFAEAISDNGSGQTRFIKQNAGKWILSGTNTYSGTTTFNSANSGILQFAQEVSLYSNNVPSGSWTAANIIVTNGCTLALNVGGTGEFTASDVQTLAALGTASGGFESGSSLGLDTTDAGGNFTYGNVLANPNSGANALRLVKLGTGTLTLNQANTYTGGTTISAGTLSVNTIADSGNSAIGNSGILTLGGGTLSYTGSGAATTVRTVTGISGTTSTIDLPDGNLILNTNVSSTGNFTINKTSAGTLTLGGTTDNSYLGMNISAGTVILNKASSTSPSVHALGGSGTTVSGGTLQLSGSGGDQIYDGSGVTVSSGVFDLNGQSETINTLSLSGTGLSSLGALINSASATTSTLTTTNGITLAADSSIGGSGNITLPSAIGGSQALTMVGTGILTLGGTNTYSGNTTISAGTLELGASGSINSTPTISITAGATFDVSASGITLTGSSPQQTLAGGSTSGAATINAPSQTVTLNSGALLSFQAAGGGSTTVGEINLAGSSANLTLNNNAVTVNVTGAALAAGTYRLMDCTGTLTGSANSTPTITGTPLSGGYTATVGTTTGSGGHVDLIITGSPTQPAQILGVTTFGTNLVFNGTNMNGLQKFKYAVLVSTNIARPLTNWTVLSTNSFKTDGTFNFTNPIDPSKPAAFFEVEAVQ